MPVSTQQFWNFSIDAYQINEVQSALLVAQDTFGLNVNLALFCLFLNKQNIYLTNEQLSQLNQVIVTFSFAFTGQVRSLRRDFKAKQDQIDRYPELRQSLLKAELLLEQQEQAILLLTFNEFHQFTHHHRDNLSLYQSLLMEQNSVENFSLLKLSDLNQYIL